MLKSTISREYDIRGVADSELLSPDIEQLGLGLGTYLQRHSGGKNINLGRDCQLSSTRLRDALVKGLLASGCDVTDIGVVPTPVLYYSAQHLKASGAIMITGSHNPPEYNGFKTVCGSGTLHGETFKIFEASSSGKISIIVPASWEMPTWSHRTSMRSHRNFTSIAG
jgi:phosphomannomutase/phosphoglucomutase